MTDHRAPAAWTTPGSFDLGWMPPPPPPPSGPPRPDLPPPPDPGWEQAVPPPPGWAPPPPPAPRAPAPPPAPPVPPDVPGSPDRPERSRPPVGLQNLLLGLGTALVAIAVVVFTAVNWSQLDASAQGLILVALTALAGAGAHVAARRQMPATAEALGTVAVLLGLADVHAVRVGLAPAADARLFWAGGLAVVSVLAAVLGRSGAIRSPQVAAGLLGQLPLLCVLAWSGASVWEVQLAVVAQAFVVLAVVDLADVPRWARWVAASWALGAAAVLTVATALDSLVGDLLSDGPVDLHRGATGGCLATAGALALFLAWRHAESDVIRPAALGIGTLLGLAGLGFGADEVLGWETTVGLVALVAALVVLAARRIPRAWGDAPSLAAGLVGAVAVLPLLGAMASMLVAASRVSAEAWERSGATAAASLQLADAHDYGSLGLALQLAALAVGVAAFVRRGSGRVAVAALAVLGLAALVTSPLLAPLTITATVLVALGAVVTATAITVMVGTRHPVFAPLVSFAALAAVWAMPWAIATPGLTYAVLGTSIAAALAVAVVARRDESADIGAHACAWVVGISPLLVGLVAWDQGAADGMAWGIAAAVAAALGIVGTLVLDPTGKGSPCAVAMRTGVELAALVAFLVSQVGTLAMAEPGGASLALAAGAIGFGLQAARPRRIAWGAAAAIELLALIWLRLDQASVVLVEAYTLPLAVVLLAVGLLVDRRQRRAGDEPSSWVVFGPALVVALAPTTWLAFSDPGSVRPLCGLVAGALVLVIGVAAGKRAFVDVGTAVVVALGLRQLVPVVGAMPNWATIGATGVALIAVGATFEQRRRDLKAVAKRYAALT